MKRLVVALSLSAVFVMAAHSRAIAAPTDPDNSSQTQLSAVSYRETLEVTKLQQEIEKLKKDSSIAYITPLVSVVSIFMLALTLGVQTVTALIVQRRAERTNLELKIADIVMSSASPAAAESRLSLLTTLYRKQLNRDFAHSLNLKGKFSGYVRREMQMELFKQIAGKSNGKDGVIEAFRLVFPNEGPGWLDQQFPPAGADANTVTSTGAAPGMGAECSSG